MIPEIREILRADERVRAVGYNRDGWQGFVPVWDRDDPSIGPIEALDWVEDRLGMPLSRFYLDIEIHGAGGRFVQCYVSLREYLIHGVDDRGNRRRE